MINFWMDKNRFLFYINTFYSKYTLFVKAMYYKDYRGTYYRYERFDSYRYNTYKHPILDKGPLVAINFDGTININNVRIGMVFLTQGFEI